LSSSKNAGNKSAAVMLAFRLSASVIVCPPEPQPISATFNFWLVGKFIKSSAFSVSFSLPGPYLSEFLWRSMISSSSVIYVLVFRFLFEIRLVSVVGI